MEPTELPCAKKTRYRTKADADAEIDRIAKEPPRDKKPVRSYLCKCGVWHITSRQFTYDQLIEQLRLMTARVTELEAKPSAEQQREERLEVRKNEIVASLRKQLSKANSDLSRQKKEMGELIGKYHTLERRYNELSAYRPDLCNHVWTKSVASKGMKVCTLCGAYKPEGR